jgi:hypothetical protein
MSIKKTSGKSCVYLVVIMLIGMGAAGCPKEETTPPAASPAAPPPAEETSPEARIDTTPGQDTTAMVTQLAKADAYDGTTDKIVSKCAACGLQMDGSAEHTIVVEGYTMHLCSDQCLKHVEKDPAETILALNMEPK